MCLKKRIFNYKINKYVFSVEIVLQSCHFHRVQHIQLEQEQ